MSQGEISQTFRASTPDAVLAYEHYFHEVKLNILLGQVKAKIQNSGAVLF